ncbi:MAG: hypothetical protein QG563_112, partial [Patescibacteria group bacterium]|nr:hypothetical protein [Patescibacteria group bacterium]
GDMTIHTSAVWIASSANPITFSSVGTATFTNNGSLDSLGDISLTGGTSTPQLLLASGMNAKTIDVTSSHTLNAGGTYTITIYGTTGVMFKNSGTFTPSTSTVIFNGDGSTTLTSGAITFNNITLSPELSTGKTYTFGAGAITVNDDFIISPTSSFINNNALTVDLGAGGISATDRIQIIPSSTAYAELQTNGYSVTSGSITTSHDRATFTAETSTITLTGASSSPLTRSAGTFDEGTSTVIFNGVGSFTLSSGITEFYDLVLSPTLTASRTYTISTSAVTVLDDLLCNPSGSGGVYELQVDMANTIDVTDLLTIKKNTSADCEWNTTGTNYALEAGRIEILSGGILTANGSTITLTGSSTPFTLSGGTFTAGTSTVVFNANADVNPMTAGAITFNNVTVNPAITADRAYHFTSGSTITFTGDVSVVPSASVTPYELTLNTGGAFTGGASSDIDVNPTGTATVVFNTNVSNYAVSMRTITIDASTTWEANASTVTLTGAVSLPFTDGGTHNAGSATYVYNGDTDVLIDDDTYGNLTLSPTMASVGRLYKNNPGATTTVNTNFLITPDAASAYQLQFLLGDNLIVSGNTTLTPVNSATIILHTNTGPSYDFTTGDFILNGLSEFRSNDSIVDINGDLDINSGSVFNAPNAISWNLAGDYTNDGEFYNTGSNLILDGASQQTLSGGTGASGMVDYTFNDLTITNNSGSDPVTSPSVIFLHGFNVDNIFTVTTANVKIRFQEAENYRIANGIDLNGQATGTRVALRSSTSGNPWILSVSGGSTVVYNVDAKDSDASGGVTIDASDTSNYDSTGNTNWTFTAFTPSLTFNISDTTVGFGNLSSGAARYATGDTLGTGSETVAHTFDVTSNAPSGYLVTVSGATLTDGAKSIDAIGGTSAASSTGSEQFGIRITASGGVGAVSAPYNHVSNYAYDGATIPDEVASASVADDTTEYSVYYLGNISAITEAGSYGTTLTYIATGNF